MRFGSSKLAAWPRSAEVLRSTAPRRTRMS
jgi:hypothetical protein